MSMILFTLHLLICGKATHDLDDNWSLKAKYKYPKKAEVVIDFHVKF